MSFLTSLSSAPGPAKYKVEGFVIQCLKIFMLSWNGSLLFRYILLDTIYADDDDGDVRSFLQVK